MASVVWASRLIEPKRHGARREALDDFGGRFHFGERHGLAASLLRRLDAEQAAHRHQLLGLVVDLARVVPPLLRELAGHGVLDFGAAHGVLQVGDHGRAPHVRLAAQPPGILATDIEHAVERRHVAERLPVPLRRLARDLAQADAFDLRVRAGEIAAHERRLQADGVENLRAAVALVGRDAHLGHHLKQALVDRLDVALLRLLELDLLVDLRQQLLDGLEGQIGIDRFRAIAGQRSELVALVRLTCWMV